MKSIVKFGACAALAFVTGCSQQPVAETPVSTTQNAVAPVAHTPAQELQKYCRVCVVDKGEKMEEYLPTRLDTEHGGKTYRFCADICQQKFKTSPAKYVVKK